MATAEDKMRIFENVAARVGLSGDVFGEYTKALSQMNNMQAYQELNTPTPPIAPQGTPPMTSNEAVSAPMTLETGQSATQEQSVLNGSEMPLK